MLRLTSLLIALVVATPALAQTADQIISAADRIRNPDFPFSLTATLTEYVSARPRDAMVVRVYSKQEAGSGQFRSLVAFQEPARDRGKLMMRRGNEVWFYDPAAKTSLRISPQQRLLGQASNGDVVTTNFALDYTADLAGEEDIQDADRQTRSCFRLRLKANTAAVTYDAIDYWVEKGTYRPVKGKFYADSGRLLKLAFYRSFAAALGAERPSETVIIDGVDTSRVTRMVFSGHRAEDIPEAWFQRDYLPRFGAEAR